MIAFSLSAGGVRVSARAMTARTAARTAPTMDTAVARPAARATAVRPLSRRRMNTSSRSAVTPPTPTPTPTPRTSLRYGYVLAASAALAALAAFHAGTLHSDASATGPPLVSPSAAGDPSSKLISMEDVSRHDSLETGIWVVINGEVYDLTEFVHSHPGGSKIILKNAGKDVTDLFTPVHPRNAIQDNLDASAFVGYVDPATVVVEQRPREESAEERARREALENLPPVGALLNLDDFERKAREILSDQAWAYYSSAGDDEISVHENRNAFGRVWFKPRILRRVGDVDTSVQLVGGTIDSSLPIYISPAAMAKLGHPEGELNLTRAAGNGGIIQGVSANSSVSLDEILDARNPATTQPIIYQLYVNKDRAASERILARVASRGCNAVMLTVDAPVMGKRERDMRAKGEVVETGGGNGGATTGGAGVASAISGYIDPNLTWDDVDWYKRICKLPLFLKGVQTVEDAALAAEAGVHGIILSNHGGRSLDFSRPALDVLIDIRQQRPDLFQKLEIWLDGGVRRGTDVVKAVALGASAVGLGRPFLYAQSGFGQEGAERAIEIMRDEIERAMRLLGVTSFKELTPDMVEVLPRTFASTLPASTARSGGAHGGR